MPRFAHYEVTAETKVTVKDGDEVVVSFQTVRICKGGAEPLATLAGKAVGRAAAAALGMAEAAEAGERERLSCS